jgi:predicted RNase H-like HicB family nuclease
VRGSEFLRKLHALARRNGVLLRVVAAKGKGSHGTVYFGAGTRNRPVTRNVQGSRDRSSGSVKEPTMFSIAYPATFRTDGSGRPVVSFPDFPRAHTDGKNMQEAFEEATDCLGSVIAAHIAEKREIPEPSPLKARLETRPRPALDSRKTGSLPDDARAKNNQQPPRSARNRSTPHARPGSRNKVRKATICPCSPGKTHRGRTGRCRLTRDQPPPPIKFTRL